MKSDSKSLNDLFNLEAYKLSLELAEIIWYLVDKWPYFVKDTLGKQFTRAADSVSANIAEGYGRFFFKEKIRFYYFSRGSLFEVRDWNNKSQKRKLIDEKTYREINILVEKILPKINVLIKNNCNQIK